MKKGIIAILIIGLVVLAWWKLRNTQLDIGFLQGEKAVVGRGDLTIPITGTGEIQPRTRAEIKPEASGEVYELHADPGQLVERDAIIISLDPEDEQRNVTRAENEVARAEATLRQQQLRFQERQTSSLAQINARLAGVEAQLEEADFRLNKTKNLSEAGRTPDELIRVQSMYDQLVAQRDGLLADKKQAEIAIELAEQDVRLAEKALETAQTSLSDAQKRLRETEIRAPIEGMVSDVKVEVGEVVQGGRTTITGGTVLATVADITELKVQTEVADADIGAVLWLADPSARPGGKELAEELDTAGVSLMVSTDGVVDQLNIPGTPVKITVDSFRDEKFEGIIERIYPEPRKIQNIVTYLVDIKVTSPNARKLALVLGMQADVEFTAQAVRDAILVPHDAIRRGPDGKLGVFVPETSAAPNESEKPRFVPCRFGLDNGLYAELIEGEGIKEGTQVYTKLPPQFGSEDEE